MASKPRGRMRIAGSSWFVLAAASASIASGPSATAATGQVRDPVEVQKARNELVAERGRTRYYPRDAFDLSAVPAYRPGGVVTGTIAIWGNNYLRDGRLAQLWIDGFHKYHPDVRFDLHLDTAAVAMSGLQTGVADIGASGRKALWTERQGFLRVFKYKPTEIVVTNGSYDVLGWTNALVIFVNKDNPLTRITFRQIDGIFGAERDGGWLNNEEWRPDFARGPEGNIRTWGQLGLTGAWKDRPIHVFGLNLRYEQSLRIGDPILQGSDKWNDQIKLFANYATPDGKLHTASNLVAEHVASDPAAIGYSGLMNLNGRIKAIPISVGDDGPFVPLTLRTAQDRTYPLLGETYFYVNRKPGQPLDAKTREFVRYVLSREGQEAVAEDGKYLPLPAATVIENLKKLD